MKKWFTGTLAVLMLFAALSPGVRASEEAMEEPEVLEEALTASDEPAAAPSEAEFIAPDEEEPFAAEEEPELWEEPEADYDPEDPLAARYGDSTLQLDGAAKTFANFTPRALKTGETLHKGIDVSNWQGTIDWQSVAASGVDFVIIRAAYTTTGAGTMNRDGRFDEYVRGAKAVGLKVGAYIFSQAITTQEAVAEAEFLIRCISGYTMDLPLVFDFEHVQGGRLMNANLSRRAGTDICNAFCERIERSGYESMVYANPYMLIGYLYPHELGRLWLAHYTSQTSYSEREYEYWQCGDGYVPGVTGNVDLDFWFEPAGSAPPEETTRPSLAPFSDVLPDDWYYEKVMSAYYKGVVKGVSDTVFDPRGTATRAQFVVMLHRLSGEPAAQLSSGFEDLTQEYYLAAVEWAAEQRLVSGYSETAFGPERPITREELVTILYRRAGEPAVAGDLSAFGDSAAVQSWAVPAMTWAAANRLVSGYEDGTLRPQVTASRAEVCTILMRYDALGK